jgi:hypothetical protein
VISQRAEVVLATVRRTFPAARPLTIYATRTDLTYALCNQSARKSSVKVDELYGQIIPYLEAQSLAKMVLKKGKLEVFAFQAEAAA